jgi:hypothetical protein
LSGKLLLSHRGALEAKYGSAGAQSILQALAALVTADQARNIVSTVVMLDDAAAMTGYGATPVSAGNTAAENQAAIDSLHARLKPDFITLIGAGDVVPHQKLDNVVKGDGDPNQLDSDLPYAAQPPYSASAADYRCITRLPDVSGGNDATYLTGVIGAAAQYKSNQRTDYRAGFALTAAPWVQSTTESAKALFDNQDIHAVPGDGGTSWPVDVFNRRAHFINCHGEQTQPTYFGQSGSTYPTALASAWLRSQTMLGNLGSGWVVAAECCYGAQLYGPGGPLLPLCNQYLASGAFAFFGSTAISYGPERGDAQADLICRYFMAAIQGGSSIAAAAATARAQFVQATGLVNPCDLKTLVEFNVLGDSSLQPVTEVTAVDFTLLARNTFNLHVLRDRTLLSRFGSWQDRAGTIQEREQRPGWQAQASLMRATVGLNDVQFATYSYQAPPASDGDPFNLESFATDSAGAPPVPPPPPKPLRVDLAVGRRGTDENAGIEVIVAISAPGQKPLIERSFSR